ncbi:MAG: dienelactone hydrolase family protein [Myxococcota bacterium]
MTPPRLLLAALAASLFLASCGDGDGESGDDATPSDPSERGSLAVGVGTASITDPSRDRALAVEVWYPASEAGATSPVIDFAVDAGQRDVLAPLLDEAPPDCVATTTDATRDAAPAAGEYPVVIYSHCYTCTRWSAHAVMEYLASHGFVVVAPEHTGDTLFELQADSAPPLDSALLAVRVADVRFVLDRVLDPEGTLLPEGIAVDPDRVGMLGHSLGSVTSGAVAQEDDRIAAAAGLAAPMDNPLIPGVSIGAIEVPLAFLVATEDNSVGEAGNIVTRNNFAVANPPVYKLEVVDAGHWSVTNIAGLDEAFDPGCGTGLRQQTEEPFDYIAVDRANALTATFVTAFFSAHLNQADSGFAQLSPDAWSADVMFDARD